MPKQTKEPKVHFPDEDFEIIQQIWKNMARQVTKHTEAGYDILLNKRNRVLVTKNRIEMSKRLWSHPDSIYIATCDHARQFWNGEMEVHGDIKHRMKAYAYAKVHGIAITNCKPNDREVIEINKMMEKLQNKAEPGFRRPSSQYARQSAARPQP